MSEAPVYMVANFVIEDPEEYRRYEKGFFPLLRRYGGEFITYDDNPATLEGDRLMGRMVMFRFPSEEAARSWFADADYQALAKHRRAGTRNNFLTLMHGLPSRDN